MIHASFDSFVWNQDNSFMKYVTIKYFTYTQCTSLLCNIIFTA